MTQQQQIEHFEGFTNDMRTIILSKGDDYAGEDRLSNFKLGGAVIGLTPEMHCLALISTKVARLGQLLNGKIPKNESVHDSLIDLANYAILLDMIRSDTINEESKITSL